MIRVKYVGLSFMGWMLLCVVQFSSAEAQCVLKPSPLNWQQKARLVATTTLLPRHFRKYRYRPPRRSFALAAKIVPGVGQPAFRYYSLGNTGFVESPRRFWPASTIKIWAALGSLMTLKRMGVSGEARLLLFDPLGVFSGQLHDLMKEITNENYDRLLRVAGLKSLNSFSKSEKFGMDSLVVQRGYAGGSVRYSPTLRFQQAGRSGKIRARRWRRRHPKCRSNCTSLFAIQEIVRRIGLHSQLPKKERFPIFTSDVERWKTQMLTYWKWTKDGIEAVLGRGAKIYNKAGSVPGNHFLDNSYIESNLGRFLLTVASPWPRRHYTVDLSLRNLNELARQTLNVVVSDSSPGPLLQPNAGRMKVKVAARARSSKRFTATVQAKGVSRLRAWIGQRLLRVQNRGRGKFRLRGRFPQSGDQLLVLQGYAGERLVSYRSQGFNVPSRGDTWNCY